LTDGTHRTGAAVFQTFRHRESGESSESRNSRFPVVSQILFKIRRIRGAFLSFSIVTRLIFHNPLHINVHLRSSAVHFPLFG
jgi:hypothetical protein